jgi:hypothetical protein
MDNTPGQFFEGLASLPFFLNDANAFFTHTGDAMPPNRNKILNGIGIHAQFRYESIGDHSYTGSLKGTARGILRISNYAPTDETLTPSFGVDFKFFRNRKESGNLVTKHSTSGHPDTFNFLKVTYNTHLELSDNRCDSETREAKLAEATKYPHLFSAKSLADYD